MSEGGSGRFQAWAVGVQTAEGPLRLPAALGDVVDGVVWLPARAPGLGLAEHLGLAAGGRGRAGQG
mgnify:CR=1 FL=1